MDCTKMPYDNEFECAIDKGTTDQPFLLDSLGSNCRLRDIGCPPGMVLSCRARSHRASHNDANVVVSAVTSQLLTPLRTLPARAGTQ